jgi:hypothetical protein
MDKYVFQDTHLLRNYFYWINERHAIYQKRVNGEPGPWTGNPVLRKYKFTNPFRENDRDTIWMRKHWTGPNENQPAEIQIFNCGFFRMFGNTDFLAKHGYNYAWHPELTIVAARSYMNAGGKAFTGAYVITNGGISAPKEQVVVERYLTPLWNARERLAEVARNNSLQQLHRAMRDLPGFGGGGFMAYEVVTDLNYTPVLRNAEDRFTWANAGPGAKRGLNRLMERDLYKPIKNEMCNFLMAALLRRAPDYLEPHVPVEHVDMRCIEHSLCEWDKFQRASLNQGLPKSVYSLKKSRPIEKGPVP